MTSERALASTPTMTVSPVSGPVGTVIHLSGNAGPGCTSGSSFTGINFEKSTTSGPIVHLNPPVSSDGSWSASFAVPPYGGYDSRHTGGDVSPGVWYFQSPAACDGSAPAIEVPFNVTGTLSSQPPSRFVGITSTPSGDGYWLAQTGGGVFSYGDARFLGSLPSLSSEPAAPIVGMAATSDGGGYWLVGSDGGVFAFGDAGFYGSLPAQRIVPAGAIVGLVPSPDGKGYWLLGADEGVFAFGDAGFYGASPGNAVVVAMSPSPSGAGYLVFHASSPAIDSFGDSSIPANQQPPSVPKFVAALMAGGTSTSDGKGDWVTGTDGGVFAFGDAVFYGSLPAARIQATAPVVGMARTPDDGGYWLIGADGGVFAFGDAGYHGSAGSSGLPW